MAEKKMIARSITKNKKLARLWKEGKHTAVLLFIFLIPYQDDYGYYTADIEEIKAILFFRYEEITHKTIIKDLKILSDEELIIGYKDKEENVYFKMSGHDDVQKYRPDRPRRRLYGQQDDKQMELSSWNPLEQSKEKERKLTDIQIYMLFFKEFIGIDKDDKEWDRQYYKQYISTVKKMFSYLKNASEKTGIDIVELSKQATMEIVRKLVDKGVDWSLQGAVWRGLPEWKKDYAKRYKAETEFKKTEELRKQEEEKRKKELEDEMKDPEYQKKLHKFLKEQKIKSGLIDK